MLPRSPEEAAKGAKAGREEIRLDHTWWPAYPSARHLKQTNKAKKAPLVRDNMRWLYYGILGGKRNGSVFTVSVYADAAINANAILTARLASGAAGRGTSGGGVGLPAQRLWVRS